MLLQVKTPHGFTLIEMVSVVVLLSILGVVAMAKLGNFGGFGSKAFFDEVVTAVRHAQKLAVSTGCDVQLSLSATGYALHQRATDCTTGAFTLDVVDPVNRGNAYQNANPDVAISPAPINLVFDAQSTVSGIAASQVFTVDGRPFTVFQNTGLVDAL